MTGERGEQGVVPAVDVPPEGPPPERLSGVAVSSFFWAFAGFAGNRVVVFITTLVLTRLLAPEDFGTIAAALVLLSFTMIFLDLGFGAALIQEQARGYGPRVDTVFTAQVVLAVMATIGLVLVAPPIAVVLGIAEDADVLRVLSLYLVIRAVGQTHDTLLRRDLRFRARTAVALCQAVVRLVVSVGLALGGAGVWALVIGTLASEAIATIVLWVIVPYRPRPRLRRHDLSGLVRFGGAVTLLQIVSAVMASFDYVAIGNRLGAVALGFYVIAYRLPELVIGSVLEVFSKVAFPVLSRARSRTMDQLRNGVARSLNLVTLFGFTTGVGLAVVAPDAVDLFFGSDWAVSAEPMALIALSMGIGSVGFGVGDVYLAMGRPALRLWITGSIVVPMSIAMLIAADRGIVAVAWVHLGTAVVFSLLELILARRIIHLPWSVVGRAFRAPIAAATGIAACTAPVLIVIDPGTVRLVLLVVAGIAGAAIGARLADRSVLPMLRGLLLERRW